jgi:transposase
VGTSKPVSTTCAPARRSSKLSCASITTVVVLAPMRNAALQRFAQRLQRDKEEVLAGLTSVYSNGQVEGQVNKLKLIKRMGYGRASFPLLRQRVLHAL